MVNIHKKLDLIQDFKFLCFNKELDKEYILKDQNCFNWSVNFEKNLLISGISSVENVDSFSELHLIKEFKRDGIVNFFIIRSK